MMNESPSRDDLADSSQGEAGAGGRREEKGEKEDEGEECRANTDCF